MTPSPLAMNFLRSKREACRLPSSLFAAASMASPVAATRHRLAGIAASPAPSHVQSTTAAESAIVKHTWVCCDYLPRDARSYSRLTSCMQAITSTTAMAAWPVINIVDLSSSTMLDFQRTGERRKRNRSTGEVAAMGRNRA
jgi:hypothetical protein